MAEKAFLQIKESESKAQDLIMSARDEAAHIIKRAEEKTADMLMQSREEYGRRAEEKKRQAETNAHKNSMAFSEETKTLCNELKQKLLLKKQEAVDAVIQTITARSTHQTKGGGRLDNGNE